MTPTSGEKTASLREDELHGECRSNRAIVSLIMSFASLAQRKEPPSIAGKVKEPFPCYSETDRNRKVLHAAFLRECRWDRGCGVLVGIGKLLEIGTDRPPCQSEAW